MTDEESLLWRAIDDALIARTPLIVLVEGDSATCLSEWCTIAATAGVKWLDTGSVAEQTDDCPFGLWVRLAEAHSTREPLVCQLRCGQSALLDLGCPLLPDPLAVYHAISRWLAEMAHHPLVVVLRDVDRADRDCLAALAFVARALENESLVLVLVVSGQTEPQWVEVVHQLEEEVGLLRAACLPAKTFRPQDITEAPKSIQRAIAWCQAGAMYTGSLMLMRALAQPGTLSLPDVDVATAWQHLAMAMLWRREFELVGQAVRRILNLNIPPEMHQLARRTWMLALHNQQNVAALREFGVAAYQELNTEKLSVAEEAWLRLDAALGCSLDDLEGCHDYLLDSILALPTEAVPYQCRAAAHLWRAASHVLAGRLDLALGHQRAGLTVLESLGEFSRSMFARSRLAATLFGLGHFSEAAHQFERAAQQSLCAGQFLLAAMTLAEAISARVAMGDLDAAETLLIMPTRKRRRIWEDQLARLLRCRAEATLALARGEPAAAKALVDALLTDLEALPEEQSSWVVRLTCEGTYLLADIAQLEGDGVGADEWTIRGLSLATHAAPEERPGLLVAGRRRLVDASRKT